MDVVCDTLLLEEILPRLAPKNLVRLGATSRRYDAHVRSPGFRRRYWRRAGVSLDLVRATTTDGAAPRFLTGPSSGHAPEELVLGATNLALFPSSSSYSCSSARRTTEEASLSSWRPVVVAHSAAGLLLCSSRGRPTSRTTRYYVCNPVTRQRVDLPELRSLCCYGSDPQCALLTVAATGTRFQVVVVERWKMEEAHLRLKVFSSASSGTGEWEQWRSQNQY